jgi:hypothetical protein
VVEEISQENILLFLNQECDFKLAQWENNLNFVDIKNNAVDNRMESVNRKRITCELKYSIENWFCKFYPPIYSPTDLLG